MRVQNALRQNHGLGKASGKTPVLTECGYYRIRDNPEGPSTQYLRSLVPNTITGMVFGTRNLKYWRIGSSGLAVLPARLGTDP